MAKKVKKKRKRRRYRLTPDERARRRIARKHKSDIRTTFVNCGFEHIPTRDAHITIAERTGEIDALFVYENILVITEDTTTSRQSDLADHLRSKKDFCEHLKNNIEDMFTAFRGAFARFRGYMQRKAQYQWQDYSVVFLYCSYHTIDQTYKTRYRSTFTFLDYPYLRYFLTLSKTIHKSAHFELINFLGLGLCNLGPSRSAQESSTYSGLLLPETASSFPTGHKLVTFLVDPNMLLERAYVLRNDSWRDTECLYQRILNRRKIQNMREYLVEEKRVFVNNIIATLPSEANITNAQGNPVTQNQSNRILPVLIKIPRVFNCIGVIDGQHRLYSYHEGNDKWDARIGLLRDKQHLLVTGIVYPQNLNVSKKQAFEAKLFLEINDKQKRVKGDLKQAIERIVNPFSAIAIAKAVVVRLATTGPLVDKLEVHFYDTSRIKTTSIVSYGLRHIVGLRSDFSLYHIWNHPQKNRTSRNRSVLDEYIQYCASEINKLVAGFQQALPTDMWTPNKKVSRVLTTTTINGLVFCMRKLIENDKLGDISYYANGFAKMRIKFDPKRFTYKSSHWKDLGDRLYKECFE